MRLTRTSASAKSIRNAANWSIFAPVVLGLLAAAGCSSTPGSTTDGASAPTSATDAGTSSPSGTKNDASTDPTDLGGDDAGTDPTDDVDAGEADAGSKTDAAPGVDTGLCTCKGKSGCAVWTDVFMTYYGFNDNSCDVESQHNCNNIAFPGLGPQAHDSAVEAAGTYDDPITAAASDQGNETQQGVSLKPGTIIYNPEVQKYYIMEDSCLECGDEWNCELSKDDTDDPNPPANCVKKKNLHIDFWMGPSFEQDDKALNECEDNTTLGDTYKGGGHVVINPPDDLPVKPNLLFSSTGAGTCWVSKQVESDGCTK